MVVGRSVDLEKILLVMSRPMLREVSPLAVFTLSHVHVPRHMAKDFEVAARWLLPRCRIREKAFGQAFEHLHRRNTPGTSDGAYSFNAANVGFEAQNVGRGEVISGSGGVAPGLK